MRLRLLDTVNSSTKYSVLVLYVYRGEPGGFLRAAAIHSLENIRAFPWLSDSIAKRN